MVNKYKKILYFSLFIFFVCFLGFNKVEASNVYGSAWSEGVGWISFNSCESPNNCSSGGGIPSYGVNLDPSTNRVSGTAWNKNIGIISFNPNDWGVCPPDNSGCDLNNFTNEWGDGGWARVLSTVHGLNGGSPGPKANSGGWDGWISLGNGNVYNATIDFTNQVSMIDANFPANTFSLDNSSNGYWWGDEVIGWIDLNPNGGIPYDLTRGGVFITELDSNLVLYGPAYVTAGNDATFTWEALNGFTPTECQRTGVGFGNWDESFYSVNTTSGTFADVEVPHDNNTQGTQTIYTLECRDGSATYQASWSVIINKFAPEVSFPYSCMAKGSVPTLEIQNLNDAENYSCDIYANDSMDPNRYVGNTTSPSIDDTNWNNIDTEYTLECVNGDTNSAQHQSVYSTPVDVCEPFFQITGDTRCGTTQTNQKYGDELTISGPAEYSANVVLTINEFFGFDESPVSISSPDSNVSFSQPEFLFNGSYDTITATYTINEANYITATNNGVNPIVVPINLDPSPKNPISLNFCPTGSGFVKYTPIYKPF